MVDYRITSVDPSALSFTGGEWDGDDARTTMPNPSSEQTDRSVLDESFVFVPTGDDGDSRDEKTNWKCPFREEPGGPASERGLLACLQAVNGARGGIDGIGGDTLQDGYDWIADALTAAGQYEDRDDAPDFQASASKQLMAEYSQGDTVTWGKSPDGPPHPNQAYGVVRDTATDGSDNFGDMIDGPFAPEGSEDNPAYLIEVLDETDDGWVPSGTMVGHRGESLESFDAEVIEGAEDGGSDGGDGFTPTTETDDGVPLYDSREAAEQAAEMAGCTGSHEMEVDGRTVYAPCGDHDTATDTIDAGAASCASCTTASLTRRAEGSLSVDQTRVEAAADALRGIVWAAGDHDLSLGGDPTGVRVPAETVDQTFDWLTEDIQDDGVGIGFDHPDRDSVAAQTGLVEIGEADAVGLSETGDEIVLTDSTLTNDQAVAAAADGQFDQLDFSVVADVAVREDDNGEPVTEDGRVVLDAVRITRIDVVNDGAVASASITTDQSDLPSLQETVAAAVSDPSTRADAVDALRASAAALQTQHMDRDNDGITTDPTDLSAARSELSAAADVIEQLESENATLTDAFSSVVAAHDADVDPSDVDDAPEAAAQAVIDAATVELREEIARVEADLAKYDTDDASERAEELKGSDAEELRRRRDRVKAEAYDREKRRQSKGAAAARQDTVGRSSATGGDTDADLKAEDMAKKVLDGRDRLTVETTDSLSASELLRDSYGINASRYQDVDELRAEVSAARTGDKE